MPRRRTLINNEARYVPLVSTPPEFRREIGRQIKIISSLSNSLSFSLSFSAAGAANDAPPRFKCRSIGSPGTLARSRLIDDSTETSARHVSRRRLAVLAADSFAAFNLIVAIISLSRARARIASRLPKGNWKFLGEKLHAALHYAGTLGRALHRNVGRRNRKDFTSESRFHGEQLHRLSRFEKRKRSRKESRARARSATQWSARINMFALKYAATARVIARYEARAIVDRRNLADVLRWSIPRGHSSSAARSHRRKSG